MQNSIQDRREDSGARVMEMHPYDCEQDTCSHSIGPQNLHMPLPNPLGAVGLESARPQKIKIPSPVSVVRTNSSNSIDASNRNTTNSPHSSILITPTMDQPIMVNLGFSHAG